MTRAMSLRERYQYTRAQSLQACVPLCTEDYGLQADVFTSRRAWA
jgi:hypothetical protein